MDINPQVSVRRMARTDIEQAASELVLSGLAASDDAAKRIELLLHSENGICLVAEYEDEFAGCLLAIYNGFHIFFSHIAVREELRGHGVGRALNDALIKRARELGAMGIITDSWLSSTGFYYNMGYRMPGAVFLIKDIK